MSDASSLLIVGGRILTMAEAGEGPARVQALAIHRGRIVAAGSEAACRGAMGPGVDVRVLRLSDGDTVLPGLTDGHAHLALMGMELEGVPLKSLRSIAEIQRAVADRVRERHASTWIRGFGYNDYWLQEKRHPTRADLDRVASRHPVVLTRTCGHIAVVNSYALNELGIGDRDPDPEGGRYGRDTAGRINGVLFDGALAPVQAASRMADRELRLALGKASQVWAEAGITGFHDAGGPPGYLPVLVDAIAANDVGQTVHAMVWNGLGVRQLDSVLGSGLRTGFRFRHLVVGPAKVMVDGSSSGPTAATREGYAVNPAERGILYGAMDQLTRTLTQAARDGFQLTTHAVGDEAVAMSIQAIRQAGYPERRHRIEHCAMCPTDLVQELAHSGITPVAQPAFLYEFGDGYVENYGEARGSHLFPLRSWLTAGLRPVGSSDSPVADFHPLHGIAAAMSRTTRQGRVLAPEERLTLEESLALYTRNAAWVVGREAVEGKLLQGFAANLTVVDGDLMAMEESELRQAAVHVTLARGRVLWDRDGRVAKGVRSER